MSTTKNTVSDLWERLWSTGGTLWDQGAPHMALIDLLEKQGDNLSIPRHGKALVPGCGRGYDVCLFARYGLDTTGIDVSATGVEAARTWLDDQIRRDSSLATRMRVSLEDVFAHSQEDYNLIYDFTRVYPSFHSSAGPDISFLCALEPSLRRTWARAVTRFAKPSSDTTLITLMFPLDDKPGGPPYALSVQTYHDLLDQEWTLVHLGNIPDKWSIKVGSRSKDLIAVWKRRCNSNPPSLS